jgi:hypothetical protein
MVTATTHTYPTVEDALAAGFRYKRKDDYGGEEIVIKGRTLVRGAAQAQSRAAWKRVGFRVKEGAEPHAVISRLLEFAGKTMKYGVYREDQVEERRRRGAGLSPRTIPILAALSAVNQRAKRCRDVAHSLDRRGFHGPAHGYSRETTRYYKLTSRALQHLVAEGLVSHAGHHRFPDGDWAEVLEGGGYCFHRPCAPPDGATVEGCGDIDGKPSGVKGCRLKDAVHTLWAYLQGKPPVKVYRWAPRVPHIPPWFRENLPQWDEDPLD